METLDKLKILTMAAKYDVACTSSGVGRNNNTVGGTGNAAACGICHAFSSDGRCISLLKILMSNACMYDCEYCVNRRSADVSRATFTPEEIADLTMNFYKRNYIEGLFLSSAVVKNPDYTMERMIEAISLLRKKHRFNGYIHAKTIPGADPLLIRNLGYLADRTSVNIELPSRKSLELLAPDKSKSSIVKPMSYIASAITQNKNEVAVYRAAPKFAPAGQSTQMIIGATPDTDKQIITLSEALYNKYRLKRVFYSAYIPVPNTTHLPSLETKPPLLREHRLYQADWLLRFYNFSADELLSDTNPDFHPLLDPKCHWALQNLDTFPVEVNYADYYTLLRVPGVGVRSAQRIIKARSMGQLRFEHLKKFGVVLKRARYFITCNGKYDTGIKFEQSFIETNLVAGYLAKPDYNEKFEQMSFDFQTLMPNREDDFKCLTGEL